MHLGWKRLFVSAIGIALLLASSFALGRVIASRSASTHALPAHSGDPLVSSLREALAEPNELLRGQALAPLLQSMGPEDLPAVVDTYEESFPGLGPGTLAMELLCERWARLDPQGAFQHIATWKRYWHKTALAFLMRSWARSDPTSARMALAEADLPPDLRSEATTALVEGWADSGRPDVWAEYIEAHPFGLEAALEFMSRLSQIEGLEALEERVEALDDNDGFKGRALQVFVMIASQHEPERATAMVERYADLPAGNGLIVTLGTQWVKWDAPSAMTWLLAQPAESAVEHATRSAYQRWLAIDPDGALDWATPESDPRFDPFRDLIAVALVERDPLGAAELANGLEIDSKRSSALQKIAKRWRSKNARAAREWFESQGLGELVSEPRRRSRHPARQVPGRSSAPKQSKDD